RDPRTQEIIKGHVSLGSLRVRQDYLLAEGLLAPYKDGVDEAEAAKELEAFALARIRQLSAHEVGHTIGLEHNFAASADDRASVMDYPHPYVTLTEDNEVDVSDAYALGIGAWDKQAIRWGYADFPDDVDAEAARGELMDELLASGLSFVADQHARAGSFESGAGPSHSRGSLWDNGADPVAELNRIMALRRVVLNNFSEAVIRKGQPLAKIEDALVPAYLMHRYQLQAAATVLGGRDFTYALKGDGQTPTTIIDGERHKAALDALLATLSPEALALSPDLVALIPPRPPMSGESRELFPRETGYLFDPVAAAGTASKLTLQVLLDPKRAARLNQLAGVSGEGPNFPSVLDALFKVTWVDIEADTALEQLIVQQVQRQMVDQLLLMATESGAASAVRAEAWGALNVIKGHAEIKLAKGIEADDVKINDIESWRAHCWFISQQIAAAAIANDGWRQTESLVPPGSPI
ncbi:MAG: peptidase, partial [Halieaceae bacterium]|nr:peptidase [Halieaceae bacterium]